MTIGTITKISVIFMCMHMFLYLGLVQQCGFNEDGTFACSTPPEGQTFSAFVDYNPEVGGSGSVQMSDNTSDYVEIESGSSITPLEWLGIPNIDFSQLQNLLNFIWGIIGAPLIAMDLMGVPAMISFVIVTPVALIYIFALASLVIGRQV